MWGGFLLDLSLSLRVGSGFGDAGFDADVRYCTNLMDYWKGWVGTVGIE
jgi:hypothetical protein